MRILFQGDSITDAGRDRRNYRHLGNGYPRYAAEGLRLAFPNAEFDFINLGISGNRTGELFDRLYPDAIALEPDVISILIGVNDVWHRHGPSRIATTDEQIALNYRTILSELRAKTKAKILILSPYVLDAADKGEIAREVDRIQPIIRGLAEEFADAYIPLHELFREAMKTQPAPLYYSADGVHPNENGARFIAEAYVRALSEIL
jgi:lysophospholipase L1-like esterase